MTLLANFTIHDHLRNKFLVNIQVCQVHDSVV